MPGQSTCLIARFTRATNIGSRAVNGAGRRDADLALQGGTTIALAPHTPATMIDKLVGDAIEIGVVLGREPGPVA
jgi:hypothetical protein